jgi:hypothetical protein
LFFNKEEEVSEKIIIKTKKKESDFIDKFFQMSERIHYKSQ